jgi:hypothetical protein
LIDAPDFGSLRSHRDGAIIIENGRITDIGPYDDVRRRQRAAPVRWLDRGTVAIFPGLMHHNDAWENFTRIVAREIGVKKGFGQRTRRNNKYEKRAAARIALTCLI